MRKFFVTLVALSFVCTAFGQDKPRDSRAAVAAETVANSTDHSRPAPGAGPVSFAGGIVLWDNGSLVNSPGTGSGGADESLLQDTSLGMGTFGFAHSTSGLFRVADDFTVTGDGWDISDITFFAYQTGSSTTSTITSLRLQIWDGVPGAGGAVVWGDMVTNRLTSTGWSGIYRGLESAPGATNRPIMANVVSVNTHLPAGTYYLDWQTGGSLGSGPWAPPVTIDGQTATGNAIQFDGSAWAALTDVGAQGMPFVIEAALAVPTLGEYALYSFAALLLIAGMVFVRKTRMV